MVVIEFLSIHSTALSVQYVIGTILKSYKIGSGFVIQKLGYVYCFSCLNQPIIVLNGFPAQ